MEISRGRRTNQVARVHGLSSRLAPLLRNTFVILLMAGLIATTPERASAQQTTPYVATDPGFRHIRAKHGWGPDDEAETRATLLAPAATFQQNSTSMRYEGVTFESDGALCRRVVVVEFADDTDPSPKGIITSYGEYQGGAP